MSGPRDTRESAEPAGTSDVPADPVPPSFGGAVPPADAPPADAPSADTTVTDAPSTDASTTGTPPASLRPPAFGLEAPWWAAESSDPAPLAEAEDTPPEDVPAAADPAADGRPAQEAPEDQDEPEEVVFGAVTAEERPAGYETTGVPPGTLVAGVGVPSVDSRRAVPAAPIVKRPPSHGDTDPDGFPPVPPEDGTAPEETVVDAPVDQQPVREPGTAPPEPDAAFEKAKQAENASSASLAPVLVPDAILPPGVEPPTGSGPFPQAEAVDEAAATAEQPQVITPVYHAEGGVPIDTPPPPGPATRRGGGGGASKRRLLLIGGGAAAVLAATGALFIAGGTGSGGGKGNDGRAVESPAATQSTPATTPSGTAVPATPVDITNEKTDTRDLAFRDVFPTEVIQLGGRTYTRERWSLNREASYAARGSMLTALERERCRKIVRATYIDRDRALAVTSGIAVMPTKAAALAISEAGDPAKYEWFRGMGGKNAPSLDRAGGYAAATVRGRYVAYAYVQWANGKKAEPGDPAIKQAAQQFLDYDLRPIVARAGN
ncbi:hypothetical protein ETD83_01695 [Actinomadura soli]|uniref:Uncharacterized protein n=1 Tax=Actinomadura soli TaxID=2508997 RepID=A0A5C4JKI1_9ACTN|nr:hypothetical protein [Actinomadura soli]TMR07158.1 hypothetical protein ETD83_01695 [Actinomadura soli]